jgi:MraZ protein
MFFGKFGHTIDEKGRLTVPSKYRDTLGKGLVITRGIDHCLYIFPLEEWERLSLKIDQLLMTDLDSRQFVSLLFSEASDCVPDRQGRVVIPADLRAYAGLDGDVVVAGSHHHLEVWNRDAYQVAKAKMESDPQGLAQRISGLGIL